MLLFRLSVTPFVVSHNTPHKQFGLHWISLSFRVLANCRLVLEHLAAFIACLHHSCGTAYMRSGCMFICSFVRLSIRPSVCAVIRLFMCPVIECTIMYHDTIAGPRNAIFVDMHVYKVPIFHSNCNCPWRSIVRQRFK